MTESAYEQLEEWFQRLSLLGSVSGMLHWDSATYMPHGSAPLRGKQLAELARIEHEVIAGSAVADLLDTAEEAAASNAADLNDWQQTNLKLMRHRQRHATCLDADLVGRMVTASSESEHIWRSARKDNDFERFSPYQERVLELAKESAAAKAEALGLSEYDALLDGYDPGTRSSLIDECFAPLEAELPALIDAVLEKQASEEGTTKKINRAANIAAQENLSRLLMEVLHFDFETGRQDVSVHPFCGGVPGDVRITTRYDAKDFTSGMMGVLHETGHALYEQGLPAQWRFQPVGEARGMSLHESQSLLIEMQMSRSAEFLTFMTPKIKVALGRTEAQWGAEDLYRQATRVERSLIRVDADEVTYPAHVILRYRLEKALLSGDLLVADLPAAWSDGMQDLLKIRPQTHAEGCLQDIHWPEGAFGYFPTYTLGAMIAAQLFDAAGAQIPDLPRKISQGNFVPLLDWLSTNVYSQGSRYDMQELLTRVTGKGLDPALFLNHLRARYL